MLTNLTYYDPKTISMVLQKQLKKITLFETLLASIVIIFSLILFAKFYYAMFTTSLHIDEIWSIQHFSSQGVIVAASDYKEPNNHIFFNILNALIPNCNSFNPARARILPGIALLIGMTFLGKIFIKEKAYIEGSWVIGLISLSGVFLDLALQARGYGFLFMFASAISYMLWNYYKHSPTRPKIVWITTFLVLGTWTIPSFAVFAFCTFSAMFCIMKDKKFIIVLGAVYGCSCLLLYLPVLKQLLEVMSSYANDWGKEFQYGQAIFKTFKIYTPINKDWITLLLFIWVLQTPFFILNSNSKTLKFITTITLATFLTLTGYLYLETAVMRAASFLVAPILVVAAILFHRLFSREQVIIPRLLITTGVTLGLVFLQFNALKNFNHTPHENFLGVADAIEKRFTPGTEVFCNFRPQLLQLYLDPSFPITNTFDLEKFSKGKLLYIDSEIFNRNRQRDFLLTDHNHVLAVTIPQRKGGFQRIYYIQSPTHIISTDYFFHGSISISTKMPGWNSNSIKIATPLNWKELQFAIEILQKEGSLEFQVLLVKNDKSYFWKTLNIQKQTNKKHFYILPISKLKKVGNYNLYDMEKITFRIKTSSQSSKNIVKISNITLR